MNKRGTIVPMTEPIAEIDLLTPGPEPEHISFSQVNMFLRCGMQYYFRYVLGRKERPRLHFTRGKSGHFAVEQNSRHKINTGEDQPPQQILDTFSDAFDAGLSEFEKGDIRPGEDPGKEKDATIETLRLYRGAFAPAIKPEAVELSFAVKFPETEDYHEPLKPVMGRIDSINRVQRIVVPRAKPVTRTEMVDNKFPGRKPSNSQDRANIDHQLTTYDMVMTAAGKPTDDLGFLNFVPPTKTIGARIEPYYREPAYMTPEARANRIARTLYTFRTVARQIKAMMFTPVDDPRVCNGCGFRDMCQFSLAKKDYEGLQFRARTATKVPPPPEKP